MACCFIGQYPINIYFPSFFDFIARNSITLNRSPKFITHNFLESVFFQKPVLISWSCLTKGRVHFSQFHFLMDFTPDIILSKFLFIDELIKIVLKSHHKLGVHWNHSQIKCVRLLVEFWLVEARCSRLHFFKIFIKIFIKMLWGWIIIQILYSISYQELIFSY